jgi:hypothetical protein
VIDDYWDLVAWDDEDTADPPYVQIYSDSGCLACLYYASPVEREQRITFARRVVELVRGAS